MISSPERVRSLAFDLIAPGLVPDPAMLAAVSQDDWNALTDLARLHRILPLMHDRLRGTGRDWPVPRTLRTAAATSFRRHAIKAARAQRALVRCLRPLAAAGISVTALKGAWLAYHAYPQPGLRPLRDLDLLVERGRARDAFAVLVQAGFTPATGEPGDLAAYMALKHQLPPLRCPATLVVVELHHRILQGREGAPDLPDDPVFGARLIASEVGGAPVRYPGREHQLLHLIIHAAIDHRFDNGPGILPDIAATIASGDVDWAVFWAAARRFEAESAAVLMLRMAQDYWATGAIDWHGRDHAAATIPDRVLSDTIALCLRGRAANHRIAVQTALADQPGWRAKTGFVARKLFPDAAVLRAAYPSDGSACDLPRLYVQRWRDMVRRSSARFDSAAARADLDRLGTVNAWLTRN